jgi:DNA-dependent RNA polymerase auxiliary subunit epsilon
MKQKMIQISAYIIASLLAVPFNGCTVAKEFDVEYEAPDNIQTPDDDSDADIPLRENTDTYYIDSESGNDSNNGKSKNEAWKSSNITYTKSGGKYEKSIL